MDPNDMITINRSNVPQMRSNQMFSSGLPDYTQHIPSLSHYEEVKQDPPNEEEVQEEKALMNEMQQVRLAMNKKNTSRVQDVMGEEIEVRRVHTRDLSQIFRSKKEIYTILMNEGQIYLPPMEDCTLDYI